MPFYQIDPGHVESIEGISVLPGTSGRRGIGPVPKKRSIPRTVLLPSAETWIRGLPAKVGPIRTGRKHQG